MVKNLILTSKKNFVWQSMQEIIPFLVDSWKETNPLETEIVDVDEIPVRSYLKHLMTADNIILTCFTPALYKVAKFAREEVNKTARFIIHLHNQATIACWPLRYWGERNFFRKSDVFISSCHRDADCLMKTYPKAIVYVVPFSYRNLPIEKKNLKVDEHRSFVFIGRISSQKNLHTLFVSLSHFEKNNPNLSWTLDIFGKEDGLGSPNMGFADNSYEEFLKNLSKELNLESKINFNGFQDRATIQNYLRKKKVIFTAPSLHSDENFGMAAFQCLVQGHLVVLSDWGGHTDFGEFFPRQTFLTQVYRSSNGPYINPLELTKALQWASDRYLEDSNFPIPEKYRFENILEQNRKILLLKKDSEEVLEATAEAEIIYERVQNKIKERPGAQDQKIFNSYADPLAQIFFESYGMKKKIEQNYKAEQQVPWLHLKSEIISVDDPHRGKFETREIDEALEVGYIY